MKLLDKKWITVLGLAMSLPSTILVTAWLAHFLVTHGYVSKLVGFGFFFLVIFNIFYWIVWHAIKNKRSDKS